MGYSQTTLSTALLPHSLSHGRVALCLCVHAQALVLAQHGGREAKAPALSTHPKGGRDHNDFQLRKHPPNRRPAPPRQRQLRWAMKRRRCGSDISRAELIFKVKEESSPSFSPLVVDSPKHWVHAGSDPELDARLIYRLLHVCTRWPRVNEHKLIPFAHQGNVQLNLICTLQLKYLSIFREHFTETKWHFRKALKNRD